MHGSRLRHESRRNYRRRWITIILMLSVILVVFNYLGLTFDLPSSTNGLKISSTVFELQPKRPNKAIIATTLQKSPDSADWIIDLLPDWQPYIFMADGTVNDAPMLSNQHAHKIPLALNRGREAASYLSFIITHYYDLPEYMVFIHGDRYQTHNADIAQMYDTLPLIQKLDLDYVDLEGYVNLRCNWKHCPEPYIVPRPGHEDSIWEAHGEYVKAWEFIFPNKTLPEKVAAPCCAQFAVDRRTIHRWPVAQYELIRAWMWSRDGDIASMKSGIILEYMWHILFGKPAYWCAPVKPCYCGTWNMCDLDCDETKGWCKGRIWTSDPPPSLPSNWPEEGQDGLTWPMEGWEKNM
ncbi:hypothetical protein KCU81_g4038, partial [Aureobasidium melanogenum]